MSTCVNVKFHHNLPIRDMRIGRPHLEEMPTEEALVHACPECDYWEPLADFEREILEDDPSMLTRPADEGHALTCDACTFLRTFGDFVDVWGANYPAGADGHMLLGGDTPFCMTCWVENVPA